MSLRPFVHLGDLRGAVPGDRVPLPPEVRHHLVRVLRLADGAEVEASDGRGRLVTARLDGDALRLTGDVREVAPSTPRLVLAQALPKAGRFDEVVRVAVELGVDAVVPLLTERTVVRPRASDHEALRRRWIAIAAAAAAQSRRPWLPEVAGPRTLPDLAGGALGLGDGGTGPVRPPDAPAPALLVAVPGAPSLVSAMPRPDSPSTVTIVIGPEGGLTSGERAALADAGAVEVGLGPSVLRTEHAGAAALAVLSALLGRWQVEGPAAVGS